MKNKCTIKYLRFIVKQAPLAVYHEDIDQILKTIIEKYQMWYDWYVNSNDNERKNIYTLILIGKKLLIIKIQMKTFKNN